MKRWMQKTYRIDTAKIAARYKISEILAEVLVKRGLFDWTAMDQYLFADMESLHDPAEMKDLEKTARLLEEKIANRENIMIIGDYDVDGVMSTYILYRGMQMLGGKAGFRIPHRVKDGYGIRDYMAQEAYEEGYTTILTCDNGISAVDAIRKAKELGMTVLLTDHHEVPCIDGKEVLPPADTIIDPKQKECSYPFKELCGAGIAYKLITYMMQQRGKKCEQEFLPYAAIATVCDVVPLLGENRILVKNGLKCLEHTKDIGLKALLDIQQFQHRITSTDLGFRIGPCINAAGRLSDAKKAMDLLIEEEPKKAQKKALELLELNQIRKDYTAMATRRAEEIIETSDIKNDKIYVVSLEDCHESVAGIVAGRIREKYYRPTLILTKAQKGLKGSGRSIPEYHMQQGLLASREFLTEFGGHALAAGFSLPEENLDALRKDLNQKCTLQEEDLIEKVYLDKDVMLEDMTEDLVKQLDWMEPFGQNNPKAVFSKREVVVSAVALCGNENQIARIRFKEGIRTYQGVDFRCELHLAKAIRERYGEAAWESLMQNDGQEYAIDILFYPTINERFGGVQFEVLDCR